MNEPTFFQVAMVTAGIAALCATLTWIIRSRIMSVSSRPPRTIPDRLFTAFLTGMAAFMVGATLLSSAAGPLTSFKGIVGRLLVGFMLAAVAFVGMCLAR